MAMVNINPNIFLPMPVVLVGTIVNKKPNFMAVGWITRANYQPPLIAISIGNSHYTHQGIKETKTFSVCFPNAAMVVETDYCGVTSGKNTDKSELFQVFYGTTKTAPMIKQCPLNLECKVVDELDYAADTLFIGEIISAFAEEKYLDAKKNPDFQKMDLMTFTVPDNTYRRFGEKLGDAWKIGNTLKKK
ncbi:MAG: flavin reductase family protein [bacterium]